ncbi:MAG: sulfite exporter TauE/SafE family protein [Bacteroidetes bacterium]|nr:sulfite exporter TauE/SafE family protein [Bacteroidota bacterium]MBS1931316.1 sulfite exporter TauE/SafE family protein [Bacteroidota bacterium]
MSVQAVLLLLLIGLLAGVLSGLIGLGGGIIIVPALIYFMSYNQFQAQGTSLGVLLLPVGILAVINYYNKGFIEVKAVAVISVAFIIGGWLGSKLALQLSQETVKKIFALILIYTAFKMLSWDVFVYKWIKNIF